jgi:Predicted nucleotide kinase
MALITISGYPSSGKSRRAEQIKAHLQSQLQDPTYTGPTLDVAILSDDSLNIDRAAYNGLSFRLLTEWLSLTHPTV